MSLKDIQVHLYLVHYKVLGLNFFVGVPVNTATEGGQTALHLAALSSTCRDTIGNLIQWEQQGHHNRPNTVEIFTNEIDVSEAGAETKM